MTIHHMVTLDFFTDTRYITYMPTQTVIAKKLKNLLAERGMTAAELARIAEVRTSFVYDVLSGKSLNPSTFTLARVANALAIPLHELAGAEPIPASGHGVSSHFVAIRALDTPTAAQDAGASGEKPADSVAFHPGWLRDTLHTFPEHLRILRINGDSMAPTLQDGDMVLVDTQRVLPSPPGIFILHDGFGLVAKRLQILPNSDPAKVSVVSDNAQYAAYERPLDDTKILGKVVWFARTC